MFLSQSTQTRLSGLDALRNISMLMVVLLHVSGVGGLLAALPPGSLRWWTLWGLEALCSCAVNCYGLLSGYLGVGHKHPLSRLGSLWLQAAFYSAVLTVLFGLLDPGSLRVRDMIAPLFPVLNGTYWYFSAYFALFLLMPFLDSALAALSPAAAGRLAAVLIAVFSVADFISPEEVFSTRGGYSVAWLAVLYLLGGCLRLHPPARLPRPWLLLTGYAGFSLLALAGKTFGVSQPGTFFKWGTLLSYTSPLMLLSALCLFLALYRLPALPAPAARAMSFCAPLSFGVYLLHAHPLVWSHLLSGRTAFLAQFSTPLCLAGALAVGLAIFAVGIGADYVRSLIFRAGGHVIGRLRAGSGAPVN